MGVIPIKGEREQKKAGRAFTVCREDLLFVKEGERNKFRLCSNSEEIFTKLTGSYASPVDRRVYVG